MFDQIKANILFKGLLKRPNIDKAYKMVGPEDSWYDTIMTVHNSLAEIRKLPHENWEITSHDGLRMKGIFYPGSSDKTMIFVHGYTSHAERESAFPGLFYHSLGFNVLIPYLRAHGPSEGKYIAFGALEYQDIMGWVDRINDLYPNGSILIHGLSMGAGIVLDLASKEMTNVKGLIADAPVRDIAGSFRGICNQVFKKRGEQVYPFLLKKFQNTFHADPAEFDRVANITQGRYPLLLSAGSMEHCEELFEELKSNNPMQTMVVILPGCNHGNGMYKQTDLYQGAIKNFLSRHFVD